MSRACVIPLFTNPWSNKGLALSPDGRYLHAGYNNPISRNSEHNKQVRKIDTTEPDQTLATVAILQGNRGKAIATDDKGRVYLAESSATDTSDGPGVHIYDANLTTRLFSIGTGDGSGLQQPEGVAVARENGLLVLYVTDRKTKALTRFALSEGSGATITGATKAGLGGSGSIAVYEASDLRGVEVDPDGRIWMADRAGKVFRMDNDGSGLVAASVAKAIDIGFSGAEALVTQDTSRTITVLSQDNLTIVDTLTPPWAPLQLDPAGQSGAGALSGIAVVPGRLFYVANETGQTANGKSTYGRTDDQSGNEDGRFYTDLTHDDNEPILKLSIASKPGMTACAHQCRPSFPSLVWPTLCWRN